MRINADAGAAGQTYSVVLQEGIKELRLAYLDPQADDETWEERWDGNERRTLPRAVRVSYLDDRGRARAVDFSGDAGGACAMKSQRQRPSNPPPLAGQGGVVLIAVLWIFVFLFVVAFEFSRRRAKKPPRRNVSVMKLSVTIWPWRVSSGVCTNFLNQQGGARTPTLGEKQSDLFDGSFREETLGDGAFRVRLVDESGKVNINRVNEETLRRIFTNLGIDETRRDMLVDSIMDWRDADDLHRTNGAENDYYATLTPAYSAKNGPLDSIEDLLWIKGMTADLFFGYDRRE